MANIYGNIIPEYKGAYNDKTTYNALDLIDFEQTQYICNFDNTLNRDPIKYPEYWDAVKEAQRFRIYRGDYNSQTTYLQLDVVVYGDAAYICNALQSTGDNPATTPEVWEEIGHAAPPPEDPWVWDCGEYN